MAFATIEDIDASDPTVEEREEYEAPVREGMVMWAGVDYAEILHGAEAEADVIVWDGGNNDFPFFRTDLMLTVLDPLRPGHELEYHPGETNLLMADVLLVNKIDSAGPERAVAAVAAAQAVNPDAVVIRAESPVVLDAGPEVAGQRVLVIEDGPTLTHGEMAYGAGHVAATRLGAGEIIDPRPYAVGSIKETFESYTHLSEILPAMGYGDQQMSELEATINASPSELVLEGTPIDLGRILKIDKPSMRVFYDLEELDAGVLPNAVAAAVS